MASNLGDTQCEEDVQPLTAVAECLISSVTQLLAGLDAKHQDIQDEIHRLQLHCGGLHRVAHDALAKKSSTLDTGDDLHDVLSRPDASCEGCFRKWHNKKMTVSRSNSTEDISIKFLCEPGSPTEVVRYLPTQVWLATNTETVWASGQEDRDENVCTVGVCPEPLGNDLASFETHPPETVDNASCPKPATSRCTLDEDTVRAGSLGSSASAVTDATNLTGLERLEKQMSGLSSSSSGRRSCRDLMLRSRMVGPTGERDLKDLLTKDEALLNDLPVAHVIGIHPIREKICTLLGHTRWDIFMASVILSNTAFMGIQADFAIKHPHLRAPLYQDLVEYVYVTVFIVELALRLTAEGCAYFYFCSGKAHWNYLDLFIVLTSLFDIVIILVLSEEAGEGATRDFGTENMNMVRIFRLIRLIKILRIARILRFVRALRTLVFSILSCLKSLIWAGVLMVLIIYVFAIILAQGVSNYVTFTTAAGGVVEEKLLYLWGTLTKSMFTLFKSVAGGISWHDVVLPLEDVNTVLVWVFVAYVTFLYFAVLNVITAVFCESAIETAKSDQDMVIAEHLLQKEAYIEKVRCLFSEIDTDGSKAITVTELGIFLNDEMAGAFFEYLELDVQGAEEILPLFDASGEGDITLDEFINGCLHLRGHATALKVAQNTYEVTSMLARLSSKINFIVAVLKQAFPDASAKSLSERGRPLERC